MARDDNNWPGAGRWRRRFVGAMVICGLAWAAAGCSQPVPESMPAAGEFFRRVGQLSMLKMAGKAEEDNERRRAVDPAEEGAVPKIPDSKIRLDLGMRLEQAQVSAAEVDFRVEDQIAVLEGRAPSYTARDRIELIARQVEGVRAVDNRLVVSNE